MLQKRHYELIARAFRQEMDGCVSEDNAGRTVIACVADTLAYKLGQDNPHFNRAGFLAACGVIV